MTTNKKQNFSAFFKVPLLEAARHEVFFQKVVAARF